MQKVIVHQKYNSDGYENSDIALLKTKSVIEGYRVGRINIINGVSRMLSLNLSMLMIFSRSVYLAKN